MRATCWCAQQDISSAGVRHFGALPDESNQAQGAVPTS
jgi:hypothetical protein